MPEGDTVWRTARHLDEALTGRTLSRTDFRVPALATVDLSGEPVTGTLSRGKHLLTRIGAAHTLHTHLKMEGSWHLYRPGSRWKRPQHEARVVLEVPDRVAVGFALGVVELLDRAAEDDAVGHLGPDLLGDDWDEAEALRRLAAAPDRPLAVALLDQRNLAGIGNMWAAEACFVTGQDPRRPVASVADLPRVVRTARRMLTVNRLRSEQTSTGELRRDRRHWVYRRRTCLRCGGPVEVTPLGEPGRERSTYWCPRCQPPA